MTISRLMLALILMLALVNRGAVVWAQATSIATVDPSGEELNAAEAARGQLQTEIEKMLEVRRIAVEPILNRRLAVVVYADPVTHNLEKQVPDSINGVPVEIKKQPVFTSCLSPHSASGFTMFGAYKTCPQGTVTVH
jgi:hypothetical protein